MGKPLNRLQTRCNNHGFSVTGHKTTTSQVLSCHMLHSPPLLHAISSCQTASTHGVCALRATLATSRK